MKIVCANARCCAHNNVVNIVVMKNTREKKIFRRRLPLYLRARAFQRTVFFGRGE